MAETFAIDRAATQPITINTVTGVKTNLGPTIPTMETSTVFSARSVNLFTVFDTVPAFLTLLTTGDVVVYLLVSGVWTTSFTFAQPIGHTLAPLCIHVVNNQLAAIWSDDDGAGNVQFSASTSVDGTSWTTVDSTTALAGTSIGGHSILYRGSVWFATSLGLWCHAPLARFITLTGITSSFTVGETATGASGTTGIVRSWNSPLLRLDTIVGTGFSAAELITGSLSGATGTSSGVTPITRFVNTTPDTGSDSLLAGAPGPANLIGSFASWDGILYFLQPKTASGPIKLYQLASDWDAPLSVPSPQWTVTTFSGIVDAGFGTVGADSGMWLLFVNRNDELCIIYSGSASTKFAKTASKLLPLIFTDLTTSLLPSSISTKTNLGITLYTDDRRRDNILQTFLIRDLSGGTVILASWDSTSSVAIQASISGSDYMLPSARLGQEITFTNIQPGVDITSLAEPFPGRLRIDYTLTADPARTLGIIPEYSIDGDQFFLMTQGGDDSGVDDLLATVSGDAYFFNWDTFVDLDGDLDNVLIRVVARISGA